MSQSEPRPARRSYDEQEVRIKLLFSAMEDWEPLYEALWEFGLGAPEPDSDITVRQVKDALRQLVQEGLVEIFRVTDGEAEPLTPPEQADAFVDPRWWRPPVDRENYVCYASTESGDAAWPRVTQGKNADLLIFGHAHPWGPPDPL